MEKMSFLYMVLFVNLMDTNWFVLGETITITATPGQNVSLPCTNDHMVDGSVVRWFVHSAYISAERIINKTTLGLQAPNYTIPGEGADYSLFIMIPDDHTWPAFNSTYECRLTSMSDGYSVLSTVTLHIYKSLPKCTSLHINDTTSIASCSYNNPSDMESLIWRSNGRTLTTINCLSSNVCTLNYTYNSVDVVPHGLTCAVNKSGMISTTKSCSINEMSFTTSPEGIETYLPAATSNIETSSITNTLSTEFTKNKQMKSAEDSNQSGDNISIHIIVIMSIAFVIILLLIIFIIYYVRRRSQYKQNPSFKSAPPDDHEYVEVDLKIKPTTKEENQEMMKNNEESVMEENQIYQSADMNGKQINDDGNVANKQKKEIKNVIVDGDYTKRIYKTREQFLGQSEALKKSASEKSNEVGTNDVIVYYENEAYESLDGININNDKLDPKELNKKGNKIPPYVHYEVLELE